MTTHPHQPYHTEAKTLPDDLERDYQNYLKTISQCNNLAMLRQEAISNRLTSLRFLATLQKFLTVLTPTNLVEHQQAVALLKRQLPTKLPSPGGNG